MAKTKKSDQTLLELMESKPGFREWMEQTDFSHLVKPENDPEEHLGSVD